MTNEVLGLYRQLLGEVAPQASTEVLRLTRLQVRRMWTGILPPRLLTTPPLEVLARQEHEYAAVADHLEEHVRLAGASLLDLGCGLGTMLVEAGRRGAEVAGVEPDPDSLALSRARLAEAGVPGVVVAGVGESLPFADASFTAITCCSVLEHTRSPLAVLEEAARVLEPGGWLYLGVPNALGCVERHYKVFLPPGMPRALARAWLRLRRRDPRLLDELIEMSPRRAEALLSAAGFEIVDSPVERRLRRLAETLDGRAIPSRATGRIAVAAARRLGLGGALTSLVRRGFFVDGAWVVRRPAARSTTR
jgi:ubiquinone/menaquinone biosynthesis C-methylase UbiE